MDMSSAMPGGRSLRARLFGPSEFVVGGRPLTRRDWPGRKARQLFLLLLGTRGHSLQRDEVLDILWPEHDIDAGSNALYKTLYVLRRALEPDLRSGRASSWIETSGETIRITRDADLWIDVQQFSQILAHIDTAPAGTQRQLLRNALELAVGPYIADEPYADWLIARREALRAEVERATLKLASLDIDAGDPLAASPFLETLLAQESTAESIHRAIMRMYHAAGQRTLALRQFERCREVLRREFDDDPEPETTRLATSIREAPDVTANNTRQSVAVARSPSMPTLPTPTVGRDDEIADVTTLLIDPAVRLVTITGPGGVGKTRLATEIATALRDRFPDGTGFVPMAAARSLDVFFPSIATVLRIPEDPSRSAQDVVTAYFQSRSYLLVLDNLEQLVDVGVAIATLVEACSGLKILATSRVPLRIRAERRFALDVLALPEATTTDEQALAGSEAGALFLQHLQAGRFGYVAGVDDARAIAQLCIRLDGLPLAIELAAARCTDSSPTAVLDQLSHRARIMVLRDGPQDLPTRHQTLQDLVLWSYDLLAKQEQDLFRRLAVFAGGTELDALEAIGGEEAVSRANALADMNLVSWQVVDGNRRLSMLETVREVATLLLQGGGDQEKIQAAHARFYAELSARSTLAFRGPDAVAHLDRFGRDLDNLRAAITWSLEQGGEGAERVLQILADAHEFWFYRGHKVECGSWFDTAFSQVPGPPTRVYLRGAICAGRAFNLRNPDRCRHYVELASSYRIETPNLSDNAWLMSLTSSLLRLDGHLHEAQAELEQALAAYRLDRNDWGVVDVLVELAPIRSMLGNRDDALASLDEAVDLARSTGDVLSLSFAVSAQGVATINNGDIVEGARLALESERLARLVDNRNILPWALYMQAECALVEENYTVAGALLRQVVALFAERGDIENASIAQISAATAALRNGELDNSRSLLASGIPLVRESGSAEYLCITLIEVSHFADAASREYEAVLLFAASDAQCNAIDMHLPISDRKRFDDALASLRDRVDSRQFAEAWAEGTALSLDDALDYALMLVTEQVDDGESVA